MPKATKKTARSGSKDGAKKKSNAKQSPRRKSQKKPAKVAASKSKTAAKKRSGAPKGQSRAARQQRTVVLTDASKVLFKWMPLWVAHSDGPRGLDVLGAMSLEEVDRLLRGWIETEERDPDASDRAASAYSQLLGLQEQLNFLIDRLVEREVYGPAEPEGVFAV